MTGPLLPGLGGLPPLRADQQFTPPPNVTAPGAAAGVVRARQVIITGGKNAGIFVYSPTPGIGNLIGSWTSAAGVDQFGNPYPQGLNVSVGQVSGILLSATSLTVSEGPILFYGNPSASVVTFNAGASGNFTVPAGVTSLQESFIGGSGLGGTGTAPLGGGGAGGGEAVVLTRTVTPGQLIPYAVGNGQQPTTVDSVTAAAGGNATGGTGGAGGTSGGTGTRFAGGAGGNGGSTFGGAGGSGGGFTQAGSPGVLFTPGTPPPSGGGAGGFGGGIVGNTGQAGTAPGGAPGGGRASSSAFGSGATSGGQVNFAYTTSTATQLLMAISSSAGTDNFGNSWGPGFTMFGAINIPTGASAGAILTSDANGKATWNAAIPMAAISNSFSNANWTSLINEMIAAGLIV